MNGNKRNPLLDERLDRMGREIIRASAASDPEGEAAATSPFLYTRIRARIDSEKARRQEGEGWLSMLKVAWRAVPAMALVAILAVTLFLSAGSNTSSSDGFSLDALFDARDAGVEQVVFADNQIASSDDEVLATILNDDDRGASQ